MSRTTRSRAQPSRSRTSSSATSSRSTGSRQATPERTSTSSSPDVLTVTGEDTFQNYQDALKLVTFEATSLDPSAGGTRPTAHIDFRVSTETPLGPSDALFTRYLPDVDAVSPVQGFAETPRVILLDDLDGDGKNDLIIADSDATSGFRFNLVVQH